MYNMKCTIKKDNAKDLKSTIINAAMLKKQEPEDFSKPTKTILQLNLTTYDGRMHTILKMIKKGMKVDAINLNTLNLNIPTTRTSTKKIANPGNIIPVYGSIELIGARLRKQRHPT